MIISARTHGLASRHSSFEPGPELQESEDASRPRRVRVSLDDIADKGISCGSLAGDRSRLQIRPNTTD